MTHLQTIFLAACVLAVLATLFYFVARSQLFAICALLVAFVLSDGIRDNFSLSIVVTSFRVSALDVLCAILLVVGIYRSLALGVRSVSRGLALLLCALLLVHITRGVLDFGLQPAINTSRPWIYFTAPLVFAATAPNPWDRRAWNAIASTGIALGLISIPYFLIDGLHTSSQYVYRNGVLTTARPIVAAGALMVLQAAILIPALHWRARERSIAIVGVMLVVVVLVQHRTVWVAGAAVAALGFVSWSRRRMQDAQSLVFGATGLVFLALPVVAYAFLRTTALVKSAAETTSSHSTLTWRTAGWNELIASHHSLLDLATGGPAGASWARQILDRTAVQSPHDTYVETFLRFGLPGLVIVAALGVAIWKGRVGIARYVGLTSSTVVLLLTTQALFGIAYQFDEVQGLILGIFISGLTLARAKDTAEPAAVALRTPVVPRGWAGGDLSRTPT